MLEILQSSLNDLKPDHDMMHSAVNLLMFHTSLFFFFFVALKVLD